MKCHFVVAVWGAWHTTAFLDYGLPSLLSPGNLPALAASVTATFYICTSEADRRRIVESPACRKLSQIMKVEVLAFPNAMFGHPIETHMNIWHHRVEAAKNDGALFCTIPADMVWADGSFAYLADKIAVDGIRAAYGLFVRVAWESFVEELPGRNDDASCLAIAPRQLVGLTLRHVHPMVAAYLRDSEHFCSHAEYVFWPVHGEGLLMRSLATTALIFDPGEYSVNTQFSLSHIDDMKKVLFLDDSDDFYGISLTPIAKDLGWYFYKYRVNFEDVGSWWLGYESPAHGALASHRFHFHAGDLGPAWNIVDRRSDFFVHQSLVARELARLIRHFATNPRLEIAARMLAMAVYDGRLRRRWHWQTPVTVFVPMDLQPNDRLDDLMRSGNGKALCDYLLTHVVEGLIDPDDVGGQSLVSVVGRFLPSLSDINVAEIVEFSDWGRLLLIDGPLAAP